MKNWKVGWIVAGGLLLILLVISLTPKKQETRPEPVKQIQPAEKKPIKAEQKVTKEVAKVSKSKPAAPASEPRSPVPSQQAQIPPQAPTPVTVNVYCGNCPPQVQTSTPPVSLPPKIPPLPPQAQATGWWVIITDQPQSYTDSWGLRWVVDTNGDFYCPWVENPTGHIGGHQMWVFNPNYPEEGWQTKLAPGCYR